MRQALAAAGVIFVEENGEVPGVRLRKMLTFEILVLRIAEFERERLAVLNEHRGHQIAFVRLPGINGVKVVLQHAENEVLGKVTFPADVPIFDPPPFEPSHSTNAGFKQSDFSAWLGGLLNAYDARAQKAGIAKQP